MTGRMLLAIFLALMLELRHWIPLRWEFNDTAFIRAWRLTMLLLVLCGVLIWFEGNRYNALPILISWLPLVLLPMQFVQTYGLRERISGWVFSLFAAMRQRQAAEAGMSFHFGYLYFAVCLLAASVGKSAGVITFLPGILCLLAWLALKIAPGRAKLVIPIMLVGGLFAYAGKEGLEYAGERYGGGVRRDTRGFNPRVSETNIGRRGEVTLSPEIIWRLRVEPRNPAPRLLRTGTFSTYTGANWSTMLGTRRDFTDLDIGTVGNDPYFLLQPAARLPGALSLPRFSLRGAASEEMPLPLPGNTAVMRDFEVDAIERNSYGLVRVYPREAVIHGLIFWDGGTNPEKPPFPSSRGNPGEDLRIPATEKSALVAVMNESGLGRIAGKPAISSVEINAALHDLRAFFHREFTYTLNLGIRRIPATRDSAAISPLSQFLTTIRRGHCEYFATAAALLLRQAGIPARYATGYAVAELDPARREYTIRGTHGHAWVRVWDAEKQLWLDFDPTPVTFPARPARDATRLQRFNDFLKRAREDFFIWRNEPANRLAVGIVMSAAGLGLAAFIGLRLWKSRHRVSHESTVTSYQGEIPQTALNGLEKTARKILGPRPPGMPLGAWFSLLRHHLPASEILDEAISLHRKIRFDPEPAGETSAAELSKIATALERQIRKIRRREKP